MNTACMYLSEALNKHLPSSYPRLHSLRLLSLGLRRTSLRGCKSLLRLVDGDNPHPYIVFRREDGDKPHPYIVFRREDGDKPHPYTRFRSAIAKRQENLLSASERYTLFAIVLFKCKIN